MQRILGLGLLVLMAVGLVAFVRSWRSTTPLGVGTGTIAGKSSERRDTRPLGQKVRSRLGQVANNPTRFQNQKVTVTGRVRGAGKLASNRNIYFVTDQNDRLLVIDDKAPPRELFQRTISGVVKVVGPPVGGLRYAYLVDVKNPARFKAPTFAQLKNYFQRGPNQ